MALAGCGGQLSGGPGDLKAAGDLGSGAATTDGGDAPNGGDGGSALPPDPGDHWFVPSGIAVAATPPMGWNSWNAFGCNVTDDIVRATADALVAGGMAAAGYHFVNVDDCWADHRDSAGNIVAGSNFPDGMAATASYLHGKGLKAGVYTTVGDGTCAGKPGSRGHTTLDAAAYAAWGMDYAKIDWCGIDSDDAATTWGAWHDALAATGRPIVFSICSAGRFDPWNWAPAIGNLWRTTDDINANDWNWIMNIVNINEPLAALAHPGAWNDPDMLEVGNGALGDEQNRTHFSLWAMMAAPLIAGNDVRTMPDAVKAILTNPEVIAVDQDPIGYQGYRARQSGDGDLWVKPLQGSGVRAVALVNHSSTQPATLALQWTEIGLAAGAATVRDLWAQKELGSFADGYSVSVPAYGTVMLKVTGQPPALPIGDRDLSELDWTYAASYWGPVERNLGNGEKAAGDGHPLTIAAKTYAKGLGMHAPARVRYRLGGRCTRLTAAVGVDDEVPGGGSVTFEVVTDGQSRHETGIMHKGDAAQAISVDVSGVNALELLVGNGGDGFDSDHADWADARVECVQ